MLNCFKYNDVLSLTCSDSATLIVVFPGECCMTTVSQANIDETTYQCKHIDIKLVYSELHQVTVNQPLCQIFLMHTMPPKIFTNTTTYKLRQLPRPFYCNTFFLNTNVISKTSTLNEIFLFILQMTLHKCSKILITQCACFGDKSVLKPNRTPPHFSQEIHVQNEPFRCKIKQGKCNYNSKIFCQMLI